MFCLSSGRIAIKKNGNVKRAAPLARGLNREKLGAVRVVEQIDVEVDLDRAPVCV